MDEGANGLFWRPAPSRHSEARWSGRKATAGELRSGTITVIQDANRPVVGEVIAGESGRDGAFFPAESYFDQYLVVKVVGRTFVNKDPLRVASKVRAWPPKGETYRSLQTTSFYDVAHLEGPPAFTFGKCTIKITDPLSEDQVKEMTAFVRSLRAA